MSSFWINVALVAGLTSLPVGRLFSSPSKNGVVEAVVRVRGRYIPSVIRAQRDVPLRITFDRQEATPCSEWVVFSQPRYEVYLPAFRQTTIELLPTACGEHLFTCRMGVYQGKLVVSDGGRVPRFAAACLRALAQPWAGLRGRGNGRRQLASASDSGTANRAAEASQTRG